MGLKPVCSRAIRGSGVKFFNCSGGQRQGCTGGKAWDPHPAEAGAEGVFAVFLAGSNPGGWREGRFL